MVKMRNAKNLILEGLMDSIYLLDDDEAWDDIDGSSEGDYAESFDGDEGFGERDDEFADPPRNPLVLLRKIEKAVRLYTEQGLDLALPEAFDMAAALCTAHSDLARSSVFHQRAAKAWGFLEGEDSPTVMRCGIQAGNPLNGGTTVSVNWDTDVGDVPKDLDEDAFEDWLWRRDTSIKATSKSGQAEGLGGPGDRKP